MPTAVFHNDTGLFVGDFYKITGSGEEEHMGPAGTTVKLVCIWDNMTNNYVPDNDWVVIDGLGSSRYSLGMYCDDTSRDYWGNLNGYCENYHGNWVRAGDVFSGRLYKRIKKAAGSSDDKVRFIKTDLIYKRKSLIGKKCRIIRPFKRFGSSSYFVEFDEEIGGCSCDGLGKAGHCLPVHAKFLVKSLKEVENVNEKHLDALKCISI